MPGTATYFEAFFGAIVPLLIYGLIQLEFWWLRPVVYVLMTATGCYGIFVFVRADEASFLIRTIGIAVLVVYNVYLRWYLFKHPYCVAYYRFLKDPTTEVPPYNYPKIPFISENNKVLDFFGRNMDMIVILFLVMFCFWMFARIGLD